jgi:hypothetical protein
MNRDPQQAALAQHILGSWILFIRQYPGLNWTRWPTEALANYLNWLVAQDALRFTVGPGPAGPEVTGLLLGWRTKRQYFDRPEFAAATYKFARPIPDGDVFYCEFLAGYPGAVGALVADYQWRHPDWRQIPFVAFRDGQRRYYHNPERFLARLEKL